MPYLGKEPARVAIEIGANAVGASEIADDAVGISEIADDAVGVAELSATGTASNTTFLRGDNAWAVPIGGVTSVNSETGAITAAHIATAVEAASGSNTFTDADHTKLDGITASANLYVHPNHSGDIVSTADGATVIQTDAVDIAMLSATGTASSTTFLRGDNTWAVAGITSFPFFKADESADNISITNGEFPFYKANGSASNIGVS
jgi:hypothetical protein